MLKYFDRYQPYLLYLLIIAGSVTWYERNIDGHTVCANCVRKYNGAVSIISVEQSVRLAEPPPFMFRPVKEDQDWKHV